MRLTRRRWQYLEYWLWAAQTNFLGMRSLAELLLSYKTRADCADETCVLNTVAFGNESVLSNVFLGDLQLQRHPPSISYVREGVLVGIWGVFEGQCYKSMKRMLQGQVQGSFASAPSVALCCS